MGIPFPSNGLPSLVDAKAIVPSLRYCPGDASLALLDNIPLQLSKVGCRENGSDSIQANEHLSENAVTVETGARHVIFR
jgi:hypothetical protein